MEIGVWLPNCRHLAVSAVIRRTAARAEELGFDSLWVSDHVIVPNANIVNFGETVYDPFVTLSLAAGLTDRVKLGTTVLIVPYRNAVVTAKMVSTLDALSNGRVILGVGAGWVAAESQMLGLPFAERGAMTDEYLRVMRELWTSPEPAFSGRYNQLSDLKFSPRPVQQPHPPVWVGGHSRAALRRTVEFGAAWHPINLSVDKLRAGSAELAGLSEAAGRTQPPAITLRNDIRVQLDGTESPPAAHAGSVLSGRPDELVSRIEELRQVGVEHLVLEFLSRDGTELDEQMTAFAEQVRPALT